MSRYEILCKNENTLYQKECPVIILSSALTLDNEKDAVISQIKFQNLSNKIIKALYVEIVCEGVDKEELAGVHEYIYMDLNVSLSEIFGANIPVYLPDKKTRNVTVKCKKILFEDGEKWESIESLSYIELPLVTKLQDVMETQLFEELVNIISEEKIQIDKLSFPIKKDNVELCVCGKYKLNTSDTCWFCKKDKEWWEQHISKEYLTQKHEERIEKQRILKIEQEKEEEKKKIVRAEQQRKIKKYGMIFGIIMAVILVGSMIATQVIIPSKKYSQAAQFMEEEDFSNAIKLYRELGTYKSSKDKLEEAQELEEQNTAYINGINYYNENEYRSALIEFTTLEDEYKESMFYKAECSFGLNDYRSAISFYEKVSDKSEMKDKANEKIAMCNYYIGVEYAEKGELEQAKEYLENAKNDNANDLLAKVNEILDAGWIGIYKQKNDDSEWIQVICTLKEDLSYEYEVYRQNNVFENYALHLSVGADGKMLLYDEFNNTNTENCGERFTSESSHTFQPDKSVYDNEGIKGGGMMLSYSTCKESLSKNGDTLILDIHSRIVNFFEDTESEEDFRYEYVRQ